MIINILIAISGGLMAVFLIQLLRVFWQQKTELSYHSNILRTIELGSADFVHKGIIPIEFTARGNNISPSLYWSNIPSNTKSLVILATDYDAPGPYLKLFVVDHWVIYNISPTEKSIPKAIKISQLEGLSFGKNVYKETNNTGPKPLIGKHNYFFRIYALSISNLNLMNPTKKEIMEAMKDNILAYGELIGQY